MARVPRFEMPQPPEEVLLEKTGGGAPAESERSAEEILEIQRTIIEETLRLKGQAGLEALANLIRAHGKPSRKDVAKEFEQIADRSEFQERMYEVLEASGALSRGPHGEFLIDRERLIAGGLGRDMKKFGLNSDRFAGYTKEGSIGALAEAFADTPVYDRETWNKTPVKKRSQLEPVDLMYLPQTPEEAFDPAWIQQQKFLVGPWEMPVRDYDAAYPGSHGQLQFAETASAAVLYHPDYGDAKREEDGTLTVKKKDGRRGPVSADWFIREQKFVGGGGKAQSNISWQTPRAFLEQNGTHLLDRDLLRMDDFESKSKDAAGERVVPPGRNKYVMVEGVKYYLGNVTTPKKVLPLNERLFGILEQDGNDWRLTEVFPKIDPKTPGLTVDQHTGTKIAGDTFVKRAPTGPESVAALDPEHATENQTDIETFGVLTEAAARLKKQTGKTLPVSAFRPDERPGLATLIQRSRDGSNIELNALWRDGGLNALKVAGLLVRDRASADGLMKLKSKAPEATSALITKIGSTLESLDRLTQETVANAAVAKPEAERVRQEFLTRVRGLVQDASKLTRGNALPPELFEKIEAVLDNTAVFASVFRTLAKEKRFNPEELRGVELQQYLPANIPADVRGQMLRIAEQNWNSQKKEAAGLVVSGLAEKLGGRNTTQSTFHVMMKDGKVGAFIRFDQQPHNTLYAASLNVSPELRSAAIGETMMRQTIDQQAKDHIIDADVFPELVAGTNYVEQQGFVITKIEVHYDKEGHTYPRLVIRRDDARNAQYRLRKKNVSQKELGMGKIRGASVERFDLSKGTSPMVAAVEHAAKKGLVGTRYWHDAKNPDIRYIAFEPEVEPAELTEAAE